MSPLDKLPGGNGQFQAMQEILLPFIRSALSQPQTLGLFLGWLDSSLRLPRESSP